MSMNVSGDDSMNRNSENVVEKENKSASNDPHSHCDIKSEENTDAGIVVIEKGEADDKTSNVEVDDLNYEVKTLSVTTKIESDQYSSKMQNLCDDMFAKVGVYLNGEVESTCSDYQLIIDMNRVTTDRYTTMLGTAKMVGDNLVAINQNLSQLHPYLDQIESIEKSVLSLEQAAYKLDLYSKQLEERFKLACKK